MAGQVLDKEERGYLNDLKPLQNTHVQSSIHKYPQTLGLPLTRSGALDRVSRPAHPVSLSQLDSSGSSPPEVAASGAQHSWLSPVFFKCT